MSVVFTPANADLSTLDQVLGHLHTTLTTVPATPWVLESAWDHAGAVTCRAGQVLTPPAVPVAANTLYVTVIYQIGNMMSSAWRVKITMSTGTVANYHKISIDCGDATTDQDSAIAAVSNPLPIAGGSVYGVNTSNTSNTATDWYTVANENGFLIFIGNPGTTSAGSYLIGCERSRNQAGTAQEDLVLFMASANGTGPAGLYDDRISTYSGSLNNIARSWNGFQTYQADAPLLLRPSNSVSGTNSPLTSFEAPGDGSAITASNILACGPWMTSGGLRGPSRLMMIGIRGDIPSVSSPINVVQDTVSRVFHVPDPVSVNNISVAALISATPASNFVLLLAKT